MSEITIGSARTTERVQRSPRFLILALAAAAAVGYLIYTATIGTSYYYFTVGELVAKGPAAYGEQVKVSGKVAPGSPQYADGGLLTFTAQGQGKTIKVVHDGVVPDIFKDDVEVVVTGQYGSDNVLVADELLAKCPSKFESAPVAQASTQ